MELCFKCGIGIGNILKSPAEEICKYCYVPEPVIVKPEPKPKPKPEPKKIKKKHKHKNCAVCSEEFKPTSNRQIVCSAECKLERTKLHHRNYHNRTYTPRKREEFRTVTCVVCGSSFTGRYNAKLCSDECRDIKNKESQNKYRSKFKTTKGFRWNDLHSKMLKELLDDGLNNKEIAKVIGCSSQTIADRKKKEI